MSVAVLLEGLNMPEGNPITINIYRNGTWVNAYTTGDGKAIKVPEPHGRLIDADALDAVFEKEIESFGYDVYGCGITDGLALARSCIETAPTIIPATEEAE